MCIINMTRGEAKENFWEGGISTLSQLSAFRAGFVPTFGQMSQLNDVFSGSVPTLYDFSPAVGGGSPPPPPHKIAPEYDINMITVFTVNVSLNVNVQKCYAETKHNMFPSGPRTTSTTCTEQRHRHRTLLARHRSMSRTCARSASTSTSTAEHRQQHRTTTSLLEGHWRRTLEHPTCR